MKMYADIVRTTKLHSEEYLSHLCYSKCAAFQEKDPRPVLGVCSETFGEVLVYQHC